MADGRSGLWQPYTRLPLRPRRATSEIRKRTRKITNINFAMPAAATAIPVNPNTAAINAITKNVMAQLSILFLHVILSRVLWYELSAPHPILLNLYVLNKSLVSKTIRYWISRATQGLKKGSRRHLS